MKSAYKEREVSAPDLAKLAIEAHGGLERWNQFTTLSALRFSLPDPALNPKKSSHGKKQAKRGGV